jgi:P27 family predicted phage terminase small subunit
MPKGRKPVPIVLMDNNKDRLTKAQIDARKQGEVAGVRANLLPPEGLSGVARQEWDRVVELYRDVEGSVINDLDVGLLTIYCEARAVYIEAQKKYKGVPVIRKSPDDPTPIENPYWRAMMNASQVIMKAAEQLCMSPVGRARMGVAAAKQKPLSGIEAYRRARGGGPGG